MSKLTRPEIYNIDVLVQKGDKRVALIRKTQEKAFQTASCIVMRKRFPDGYILKKKLDAKDEEGTFIDCKLPFAENNSFDLGKVDLKCKYAGQIKLAPEKLRDLKQMGEDLQKGGKWIEDLLSQQEEIAAEYPEEDLITVFPEDTVGHDNYFSYEEVRRIPTTPDDPNEDEPNVG